MALSGLDIYKLLPKTNCKACGFATCLAFAMALAQKKTTLDKCTHLSAESRSLLENAAQPPIKSITIGTGENKIEIGNETVMFRHEEKFRHPTVIGVTIDDTLTDEALAKRIESIRGLNFERVGQKIGVNLVCVRNSSGVKDRFILAIKKALETGLNIALFTYDIATLKEALTITKDKRPLIIPASAKADIKAFAVIAKESGAVLAVTCETLDDAATATASIKNGGFDDLAINLTSRSPQESIEDHTYARRMALKKNFRPLGYPVLSIATAADRRDELLEAMSYILKYSSIVIINNIDKDFVFPLLVVREDIYQDPQKPVQVEPKIYEVGKVTDSSPLIVTTNFSITYFTVLGEVEASKVPCRILCADAEGMSVLTAWAADKFNADTITRLITKHELEKVAPHKSIIIPGYVAVMSGKLEETSGWKVIVGPREASGIPSFLRNLEAHG